ncbi:type II toxin-antitoxin system RelE/ParE family toxin [Asticcacaulis sp. AC402]|uniref:type II toxin-antitoxin system RelE/ParE family toxin n=1 Tax=Asticcacaulis sp. AC402 TaxID=1282361 RepID=UPI0009E208A9
MRWEISRQASDDIDDIIRYTDTNLAADQTRDYVGGLFRSFDLLADNPEMGRVWAPERRCYIYRSHYVFYRIMTNYVVVSDIRNTRQALPEAWQTLR